MMRQLRTTVPTVALVIVALSAPANPTFSIEPERVDLAERGSIGPPITAGAADRIVAIGDIHGAYDELVALLQQLGLVDRQLRWSGGDTRFVQTGDFTDRGLRVKAVMDLLMRLQEEADEAGGRVDVLLANHEGFQLVEYYRDINPDEFAFWADEESDERPLRAWMRYKEFRRERADELGEPEPVFDEETEQEWFDKHPPGFFNRMEALGPDGPYGEWLRELPAVVTVDDTLFVHGGISPQLASWSPEEINERIRDEIELYHDLKEWMVDEDLALPFFTYDEVIEEANREYERLQKMVQSGNRPSGGERERLERLEQILQTPRWFLLHEVGPLWFRGLAHWSDEEGAPQVDRILDELDVDRIVVGHTTQVDGTIRPRFDNRVFIIDTGMLRERYEGGRPSALEFADGAITAIYPDETTVIVPAEGRQRPAPAPRTPVATGPVVRQASRTLAATPGPASAAQEPDNGHDLPPPPARTFLGPDHEPLPFDDDDEVLEFLRNADVVGREPVGTGITEAERVVLERDGVRARAIFHDIELKSERKRLEDRFFPIFRDSWRSQVAAYELARLLGIDNVPPTVVRRIGGTRGSLQLWIEGDVMTNTERIQTGINPPDLVPWLQRIWTMRVFDNLIYNDDRNPGNVLIDGRWNVWMIDHTRAFQGLEELRNPEQLTHVEKRLWRRLREIPDERIRALMEPHLELDQMAGLLARRQLLIEAIEQLISDRGRDAVLFEGKEITPDRRVAA